jgi:regulator of protease activity HflC (stomatin/prohibitin superfamily)
MFSRFLSSGVLVAGAIVALLLVFSATYTIDQGERGVILRNGALVGTAEPGLGFKLPLIDSVQPISIQTQARPYENLLTYSRDQQVAGITLVVNWRAPADQVADIYASFGGTDGLVTRLLDPAVSEEVKTIFGTFNAASAIQDRGRLDAEVTAAIQEAVRGPIVIESVQITNIDFSDAYEQAIEQRMQAEVEVARIQQNAERERVQAEIAVIQAQAQADAQIAQATAVAEATRLQGQAQADARLAEATAEAEAIRMTGAAEAEAIEARGAALRDNPSLIELVQAEKWDGQLPTTMVPGGAVPFVDVGPATRSASAASD